jgi:hypothetical protein
MSCRLPQLAIAMAIVATGFAASARAAGPPYVPRLCDTPQAWEGRTSTFNYQLGTHDLGRTAYDAVHHRVYEHEEVSVDRPGRRFYSRIFLYEDRVMYTISSATGECTRTPIPAPQLWRPFGVPPNATFVQQVNIGVVGEGFTANEFKLTPQNHPEGYFYRGTFTAKDCAPVMEQIERNLTDIGQSEQVMFTDIVLGIADPNVFIPPAACSPAQAAATDPASSFRLPRLFNR